MRNIVAILRETFRGCVSQWQSASDEHWARALAREAVIRPLTDQPELGAVYDLSTIFPRI
jgi:hypothetical protein